MNESISIINKNISDLIKLKNDFQNQIISEEKYIDGYNEISKRIIREKFTYNRKEPKDIIEIPEGFDFWFKKYYNNIVSMSSLCNLYNKHRIQMTTIVNKYAKINNFENKLNHLSSIGYSNPRMIDIPFGYDETSQKFLNECHLETFDIREVYNSGIADNQSKLEYLIYNYYNNFSTDPDKKKIIKITFGDPLNPAIIDISKFKFSPSEKVQLDFQLINSTAVLFAPNNYKILWTNDLNKNDSKACNIKMDLESSILISTEKYTELYTNTITKNVDTDIVKNKILYHKDGEENLITVKELEDEIYEKEGVRLDIRIKNTDKQKDEIYVHHYAFKNSVYGDLDCIHDRLIKMGLDI